MAKKIQSYQAAIEELETILDKMEQNELQIDELSNQVKRASALINFCKTKLKSTEEDVENILAKMEGE